MYDLNLIPISTQYGQQQARWMGFQAFQPPRRAARSRSEDLLILYLTTNADEQISDTLRQAWIDELSQAFFKIGGSVTSALKALVESLNQTLLDGNLQHPQATGALTATLNLVVMHGQHVYIAQSGLTHVYTLTEEGLTHYSDSSQTDRGLGVSRTPTIRYFHADLGKGGYLFMTDTPTETWTEDRLVAKGFPNLDQLKRRLLNQAPQDFRLGLVQIQVGDGQINVISTPITEESSPELEDEPLVNLPSPELKVEPVQPVAETSKVPSEDKQRINKMLNEETSAAVYPIEMETNPDPGLQGQERVDENEETEPQIVEPIDVQDQNQPDSVSHRVSSRSSIRKKPVAKQKEVAGGNRRIQQEEVREKVLTGIAKSFDGWHKFNEKADRFFKDLIARWSSKDSEETPKLSTKTMLLIALIVPLVVVAIAASVYVFRGRALQYDQYLGLAEAKAIDASQANQPDLARSGWEEVLSYLAEAESYKQTVDTVNLKAQAQAALDLLDGAVRLRYHSAIIGSLPLDVNITRIISYGVDLYLLDSAGGRVIHTLGAGNGYEIDDDFLCQGGNYSGGSVGSLVDMISMPPNNTFQAHILAIDTVGNVIYCAPGQNPIVKGLPGSSAGITRIAYESNTLYVLNPEVGTVLVYQPTNGQYLDPPTDYFEDSALGQKPDLSQVTDMDVNGAKLYLLRDDGLTAECMFNSSAGAVNCVNPVSYLDSRTGGEDQLQGFSGGKFSSILYNAPPTSTISILDSENGDIYQFSLSYRLSKRLRPDMGDADLLSTNATAFTIGMDRVVYIAFENQVFFAYLD